MINIYSVSCLRGVVKKLQLHIPALSKNQNSAGILFLHKAALSIKGNSAFGINEGKRLPKQPLRVPEWSICIPSLTHLILHCQVLQQRRVSRRKENPEKDFKFPVSSAEIIPQKLSGLKRKQVTATSVVSSSKFPRPAHKEWSCALCQVSATCEEGLNEHLQGKKHQAKAAQLAPKKNFAVTTVDKDTVAKDGGDGSGSSASKPKVATKKKPSAKVTKKVSIKVDGKIHEVVEKGRYLWCWMCRVKCNCQATMIGHLSGKRHLQESNKPKASNAETTQNKEVVKNKKECTEEAEQPGGGSANETGITQNEKVVDVKKEGKEKVEEPGGGGSANEIGTTQNEEVLDVKKECTEEAEQPGSGSAEMSVNK